MNPGLAGTLTQNRILSNSDFQIGQTENGSADAWSHIGKEKQWVRSVCCHGKRSRLPAHGASGTGSHSEMARIGCSGRFMDASRAVFPPTVKLAMHFALTFVAICRAARMIADAEVPSVILGRVLCRYME